MTKEQKRLMREYLMRKRGFKETKEGVWTKGDHKVIVTKKKVINERRELA